MKHSLTLHLLMLTLYLTHGFCMDGPEIITLATEWHCRSERLLSDIRCACYFAHTHGVLPFDLRMKCESFTSTHILHMKPSCALFLNDNNSDIKKSSVLRHLKLLKSKCLRSKPWYHPARRRRATQMAHVVKHLCVIYEIHNESTD